MVLLSLQNVSKAFGLNAVLSDISLTLMQGSCMGLIGVNGSGKSTLMKIIAGELSQDAGTMSLARGTTIGMLSQHADIDSGLTLYQELEKVFEPVQRMEARLRELEGLMAERHEDEKELNRLTGEYGRLTERFESAGGYEWPSRIQGVLAGLGFAKGRYDAPAAQLSGGEKTRLCLARILLMQPDLLMLDEPTNHLDLDATAWLEDTLKKYKGTVLLISHDRYFLNAVCDQMGELSMTRLVQYTGNYDEFMKKREAEIERQLKEYTLQQKEVARQEAIIARYKMYNTEASLVKARSREKLLDKLERVERPVEEAKVRFRFGVRRRSGDDVLMVEHVHKSFDNRPLLCDFSVKLRQGDRVALIGPNGVGKTTLFHIITGKLRQDAGEVRFGTNVDLGYYDQHQSGLHENKNVLNELWDEFPRLEHDQIRGTLALFLLTGDDVFQPIHTLSGGEKGRVALSKLMLKRDNLLLLDEPTNHLDMDSREVLEHALHDFPGTILSISHDRYFINRIANRVIELTPEGVTEYLGNYDDYLEKKRRMNAPEDVDPYGGKTRTEIEKEKRRQRLLKESEKEIHQKVKDLETRISDVENRMTELELIMSEEQTYQDRRYAEDIAFEHSELAALVGKLYEEWEEAAEVAAGL